MPATQDEMVSWIRRLLAAEEMPDAEPVWADGTGLSAAERETLTTLILYEARCQAERRREVESAPARRTAMRLLRRFLSPRQLEQLRRCGHFDVIPASGRVYRLWPRHGRIGEVERHGRRLFEIRSFCLHPEDHYALPPGDVALAQLLLLSSDEAEFLRTANTRDARGQLWNGDWMRTLRQARLARQAQEAGTAAEVPEVAN